MKIVKLNGEKFLAKDGKGYYVPKGYALKDEEGFIALTPSEETPYTPIGGRKALQSIIDAGGFVGEIYHLQPMGV